MAMSSTVLGLALKEAVKAKAGGSLNPLDEADLLSLMEDIASEIIDHITTFGVVSVSTTGVTGSGTPGGPLPISAQPGTGTIA